MAEKQNKRKNRSDDNTKMEDKAKIKKCKYSHPHFKNNSIEYHCVVNGWEDDKVRICKKKSVSPVRNSNQNT